MQIICGALLLGIAVFAGFAVFFRQQNNNPAPAGPLISYTAIGFAVATLAARLLVLAMLEATARRTLTGQKNQMDPKRWLDFYQTRMIVGTALLEGAAFCALLAYMLEGTPWTVGMAVLLWVAIAWLHFPTRDRVAAWIAAQQDAASLGRTGG
jgi:hypothetical protein